MARPKLRDTVTSVVVRVTDDELAALDHLVVQAGSSRSEVIRHLIVTGFESELDLVARINGLESMLSDAREYAAAILDCTGQEDLL